VLVELVVLGFGSASPLAALRHHSLWGTDEFFFAHHHSFGKALGSRAAGRIGWC